MLTPLNFEPSHSSQAHRNLARAVEGMPLTESDSVLGANGNKWEAHSGATAPGQFCAFDSAQGRAVRNFYTDFANEVV